MQARRSSNSAHTQTHGSGLPWHASQSTSMEHEYTPQNNTYAAHLQHHDAVTTRQAADAVVMHGELS